MADIDMDVDTAVVVPVNIAPLTDSTDFKSREQDIAYNAEGMDLTWNFVTPAGATSCTAVTPTTGGNYDWAETVANKGMYCIEIPASGGATINNDTEGTGWFTGLCTGVLPWRGPTIRFRRKALNDMFVAGGTASTNLEDFFDGTGYAGGTVKTKVDVETIKTQTVTCGAGVTVLASVGTAATSTAQTGDGYALLNTELADLIADIGTNGAGLTAIPWNAAWDAEVQSECTDALTAFDFATDAEVAATTKTAIEAAGSHLALILADTGTDGVVLAADAITAAKIADDAISSEHLATGALTADAFAADAIVAATVKADAVTKVQAGLATSAEITALTEAGFKKNTEVPAFGFIMFDSTDHVTPKTGLTVTATRQLDGAAFGACANAVSETGTTGFYQITLAAADMNANIVVLKFTAPGADTVGYTIKTAS